MCFVLVFFGGELSDLYILPPVVCLIHHHGSLHKHMTYCTCILLAITALTMEMDTVNYLVKQLTHSITFFLVMLLEIIALCCFLMHRFSHYISPLNPDMDLDLNQSLYRIYATSSVKGVPLQITPASFFCSMNYVMSNIPRLVGQSFGCIADSR